MEDIEILSPAETEDEGSYHVSGREPGQGGNTNREDKVSALNPGEVEKIREVSPYAKASVANFIRRMNPSGTCSAASALEVREVQGSGGQTQFHARLRLPLPPAYGERYGEGFAATAKEAEMVAAMHAERVIDMLGLPLFLLSSKQRKHAEAARAAGRWAPMPVSGEDVQEVVPAPTTLSPPPLVLVALSQLQTRERELHIDHLRFMDVRKGGFKALKHTLTSPYFFDKGSEARIESFLRCYETTLRRCAKVTQLEGARYHDKRTSGDETPESCVYLAQLTLPVASRFGVRTCVGKAPTVRDAVTLACMHAELTIDALGLPLYPSCRTTQEAHAAECAKVRRWCAPAGDCAFRYKAATPPPLRLVSDDRASLSVPQAEESRFDTAEQDEESPAADRMDEVLREHQKMVAAAQWFTEETAQTLKNAETGKALLERYLEQFTTASPDRFFFEEGLGVRGKEIYRVTITVPYLEDATMQDVRSRLPGVGHESGKAAPFPLKAPHFFVALGVSDSSRNARIAASLHALRMLAALNRAVLPFHQVSINEALASFLLRDGFDAFDPGRPMRAPCDLEPENVPSPVRCLEEHVGRIVAPGMRKGELRHPKNHPLPAGHLPPPANWTATAEGQRGASAVRGEDAQTLTSEMRRFQRQLPREVWDITADAVGRIVVPPHARATDGRNYVHTLPSVRGPDTFAVNRLRDYLERHGKTLETAVCTRSAQGKEGEGWVGPLYRSTLRVPLPDHIARDRATPVVAQGEAATREDALLLCAVHLELLVDAAGAPFYDHSGLQRKHADVARMLGRWAPAHLRGEVAPQCAPPPPLRKLTAQSPLWHRLEKDSQRTSAPPTSCFTGSSEQHESSPAEARSEDNAGKLGAAGADDEALCQVPQLRHLHRSKIFANAHKYIVHFFRRRGSDFYRAVRQYAVKSESQQGRAVHRAIVEIPLPPAYGTRFGVGVANSKKQALQLCAMHALEIVDTLRLPIFSGPRQEEYRRLAAIKGRDAGQAVEGTRPPSTPTPPGLCCLDEGNGASAEQSLPLPHPPDSSEAADPMVWSTYLQECKAYFTQKQELEEQLQQMALLGASKEAQAASWAEVETVEMETMIEAHQMALPRQRDVLDRIGQLSRTLSMPVPPEPRYEVAKLPRGPENPVFVSALPLYGTCLVARGVSAESPSSSKTRAAMHYCLLVERVVVANMDPQRPTSRAAWTDAVWEEHDEGAMIAVGEKRSTYDPIRRCFTPYGELHALELWASLSCPPRRVRLAARQTEVSGSTPAFQWTGTVSVVAQDQRRVGGTPSETLMSVTAERHPSATVATAAAVHTLGGRLGRDRSFQAVVRLVERHPALHLPSRRAFKKEGELAHKLSTLASAQKKQASSDDTEQFPAGTAGCDAVLSSIRLSTSATNLLLSSVGISPDLERLHSYPITLRATQQLGLADCRNAAASVVWVLAQCIPLPPAPVGCSSAVAVHRGRLLPYQIGKLLVSGLLLGCGRLALRVASFVICAGTNSEPGDAGGAPRSLDVVDAALRELVAQAPPPSASGEPAAKACERVLVRNMVEACEQPATSVPKWMREEIFRWSTSTHTVTVSEVAAARAALQAAVAAAVGPDHLWLQVPVEEGDEERSRDGPHAHRTARLLYQHRRSPLCGIVEKRPADADDPSWCTSASYRSSLPCFAAFDVATLPAPLLMKAIDPCVTDEEESNDANRFTEERSCELYGACVSSITAVVASSSQSALALADMDAIWGAGDELPTLLLLWDGLVPFVVREPLVAERLRGLGLAWRKAMTDLVPLSENECRELALLIAAELE